MNDDDPIRERLNAWKVEPAIPNRFHSGVWARIREREHAHERTSWTGFLSWLFPSRAAWQFAAVTAAIVIAAGASLGNLIGASANEHNRTKLALRYAQSVDPYLQVNLASPK